MHFQPIASNPLVSYDWLSVLGQSIKIPPIKSLFLKIGSPCI
jgi:hypothetical protein